jgi:hypothetical protein
VRKLMGGERWEVERGVCRRNQKKKRKSFSCTFLFVCFIVSDRVHNVPSAPRGMRRACIAPCSRGRRMRAEAGRDEDVVDVCFWMGVREKEGEGGEQRPWSSAPSFLLLFLVVVRERTRRARERGESVQWMLCGGERCDDGAAASEEATSAPFARSLVSLAVAAP